MKNVFPKRDELEQIYHLNTLRQHRYIWEDDRELIEKTLMNIGYGLRHAAEEKKTEYVHRVSSPLNPFESKEKFDAFFQIISERIEDWDDFDVSANWTKRTITISWSPEKFYPVSDE